MALAGIPSAFRGMKRLKQISAAFIHHGFYNLASLTNIPGVSDQISKREREYPGVAEGHTLSTAQRTRMVFEELGPTFIKLGQMLSLEPDIIPTDFVEEFKKLQDEVPPFSFEKFQEIIELELGRKQEDVFRYLNPIPEAAASISQVHFGVLHSGEEVAVKVQRPDIAEVILEDIKILRRIARTMEKRLANMEFLNPGGIVDEFEDFITKELNFTNEAANIERFAGNFKNDKTIYYIPEVFWDFTTPRVLVMERLEGFAMDEVDMMIEAGLDPIKVAQIGLEGFAQQILDHGYFHADPHPGNSLAMTNGKIGLIDFGIMGFIDQELMRNLANIFVGYSEHDYDRLITVFISMGLINDKTDLKNFKYDLMNLSEPFYGRSLGHIQVKDVFDKIIALAVKYRLRLPRELILLLKTMVAFEGMGKKLSPDANILEVMKPYAVRVLMKGHDPNTMLSNLRHDLFGYANILKTSPDLLHKLLTNLVMGKQEIGMVHKVDQLEEIKGSFISSFNRIAVGMVIGTSVMGGAWILSSDHQAFPVTISMFGIHNTPITTLLGLISYTVATVLGVWFAFTIFFHSD